MISLPLLLLLCAAGCRQPLEPSAPPETIRPSPTIATDSACRTVTMTLVGSNNLSVTFPDRTQCGTGVIVIPGGTPTRSGPGKRNVNLPVRLLNTSGYTIQSPARVVLPPGGRVVLDPSGQPGSKLIPQNADSVRAGTGEWVWLVGVNETVPVNDSTAARTLVIRLDSPVTSGQVIYVMEASQLTPQGWLIAADGPPPPDTTKIIQRPGTPITYFRTDGGITFKPGVSDSAKQALFQRFSITVMGMHPAGGFFIRIPDPGTSIEAFDSFYAQLNAEPDVLGAGPLVRGGLRILRSARFPSDAAGLRRSEWLRRSDSLWGMIAIRAPQAPHGRNAREFTWLR